MGTTRTLADGEAFVQGRSKDTAEALVTAAADLGLKGSVKTTYDGYRAPVEVVEAAGFATATESSAPENPADHSDPAPVKADAGQKQEATEAEADANAEEARADLFDPTSKTIAEVEAYLAGADDDERARVIAAEQESTKPRKGVLDLAATTEEGK
jgi:hypothetical protein